MLARMVQRSADGFRLHGRWSVVVTRSGCALNRTQALGCAARNLVAVSATASASLSAVAWPCDRHGTALGMAVGMAAADLDLVITARSISSHSIPGMAGPDHSIETTPQARDLRPVGLGEQRLAASDSGRGSFAGGVLKTLAPATTSVRG